MKNKTAPSAIPNARTDFTAQDQYAGKPVLPMRETMGLPVSAQLSVFVGKNPMIVVPAILPILALLEKKPIKIYVMNPVNRAIEVLVQCAITSAIIKI
ncbi:hypothetical protein BKA69DRAFT_1128144 [Paraphysoderma sedebokerense]|nr:hypothetical protein BKA69DRAFT_1128144 [Paraphysoderma sedebokerense]